MAFVYDYPRPMVTVDAVIVGVDKSDRVSVMLIRRERAPFADAWALPGGFVEPDEDLEAAVRRELREETGVAVRKLVQLGAYGTPGRDPRGHTISIAYLALGDPRRLLPSAADDARDVRWFSLDRPPPLAFDHKTVLRDARTRLRQLADGEDGLRALAGRGDVDTAQRLELAIAARSRRRTKNGAKRSVRR